MNLDSEEGRMMSDFLEKYRRVVNPNLMFVSVDLSGFSAGCVILVFLFSYEINPGKCPEARFVVETPLRTQNTVGSKCNSYSS